MPRQPKKMTDPPSSPAPKRGDPRKDRPDAEKPRKAQGAKAPGRVAIAEKMNKAWKVKRVSLKDVPDEPKALQAVGLCGRKNKTWRIDWVGENGAKKVKTFAHEGPAREFLADLQSTTFPEAEIRRSVQYDYCHKAPSRASRLLRRAPGAPPPACPNHGGKSLHGPAAGNWGEGKAPAGKYRHILGGNYLAAYEQSLRSGDIPNLREQIALVDVREETLMRMIEERRREIGDAPVAWRSAGKLVEECRRQLRAAHVRLLVASGSLDDFMVPFEKLERLVTVGGQSDTEWEELLRVVIPGRRKLVETQNRMTATSEMFVPVEETLATAARMVDLVRKYFGRYQEMGQFVMGMEEILGGVSSGDRSPAGLPMEEAEDGEGVN